MILKLELSGEEEEVHKFLEVIYALSDTKVFELVRVEFVGTMEN